MQGQGVDSLDAYKSLQLKERAGIGLKFQHIDALLEQRPELGFVEVHAENYMVKGGIRLAQLEAVRAVYPLSVHGVGLSLGGDEPLDLNHLQRLKKLVERFEPLLVSEHLAWSGHAGHYLNDLLPVAYTEERLRRMAEHVDQLQNHLGRTVLIENPSVYLSFSDSELSETEFIRQLIKATGCRLLLDVNNVYVSCVNLGSDPYQYLYELPLDQVGEIHIAGHAEEYLENGQRLLIDTHGSEVIPEVWDLYSAALKLTGAQPTLLERDTNLPDLEQLVQEARMAEPRLRQVRELCDAG